MTDLYRFLGTWNDGKARGPVYILNADNEVDEYATDVTGKWLLTADLRITGGGM